MTDLPFRVPHAGGPLALNFGLASRFLVVLAGNVSALSVANLATGDLGRITFLQDTSGGHTVSIGALTAGAPAPVVDLAPDTATRLQVRERAGVTKIWRNDSAIEQPEDIALAVESVIGAAFPGYSTLAEVSVAADQPAAVTVHAASGAISSPRVVRSLGNGSVAHADPSDINLAAATCGISQNAAGPGEAVYVRWLGEQDYDGWAFNLTLPIFCGPAGVVTQTPPTSGWCRTVGYPLLATRMRVAFDPPIFL